MELEKLKAEIKKRYGKIAVEGNSDGCCGPDCCNSTDYNPQISSVAIGYDEKNLESIPKSSILGLGCGAPLNYAQLKSGETVVDLGSGAGIDAFLASKQVQGNGKVIGIDFTDEMLQKASHVAKENGFTNVEFRKGDIESNIPIDDNTVDVAISNCVINLASDKVKAFKEVYRILKKKGKGRIVISDLITSKEVGRDLVNVEDWCSCIDGALTKENYLRSIEKAGFQNIRTLSEEVYLDEAKTSGRKITSLIVSAETA
ncbi:MAG TPA: arsenite methyltransferase [Nitrososphaeraceae archaeon]